jgi:hypothetical protein
MDYGRVLSRAWEITWRYKVLWILGFLVALGSGNGGAGSGYRFGANDFRNFNNFPSLQPLPNLTGLLVTLGCLALIVALVVFVLSLIARGGLIAAVIQAEDGETLSLSSAWRAGGARFWTLLGIWALTSLLPAVLLIGVAIIGVVSLLGAAGGTLFRQNPNPGALIGGGAAILVACCCTSICGLIIITGVLQQIRLYAERAAMLEGRGAVAAFGRGWQVLRQRFGPTLMLWLIFLLIGLALAAVIIVVVAVVALPFVVARGSGQAFNWLALPVIATALVGIIVGAIIGSVVQVFVSASWTLAYRELTGAAPAGPSTPGSEPPAPWPVTPLPSSEVPPTDKTPPEPPLDVPPDDLPPEEPPRV